MLTVVLLRSLQKNTQFANGEKATADWVDYHSPWSPRGDGYQDPAGSSSGAGASVAAYDWIDLGVGSDTGGSIRGPSATEGLFGNRPSHGSVPLDGIMPLSPTFDTAGVLIRDPFLWDDVQAAMYGSNYTSYKNIAVKYPTTVYTVGFPRANATAAASVMLNKFATALAAFVKGTLVPFDINDAWAKDGPAAEKKLIDFVNLTYPYIANREQVDLVREPFFKDYAGASLRVVINSTR